MPPTEAHLRLAGSGEVATSADLDELLGLVARGDEAAFATLYDAVGASVYGLARRVVRDPSRVEEIAQEVFIQVWKTAPRFDPDRGKAKSWILTIAHRRSVDAVRHHQAASNRENRYDWSKGAAFDEVEETVTVRLEYEQVRRCLKRLTALQREAIELAYYQGFTYAEVAEVLGATVKTRMRDGIVRLRDCMGVRA